MAVYTVSILATTKYDNIQSVSTETFCEITKVRVLDNSVLCEAVIDKYRGLDSPVVCQANIQRLSQEWLPSTPAYVEYKESGYFSSMDSSVTSTTDITTSEYSAMYAARVYVVLPELGTEYEIPQKDIGAVNLVWGVNQPIQWRIALRNHERDYTKLTGNFAYIFNKGVYCNQRSTRKFVKIKFRSWCGEKIVDLVFPKLVIKEVSGTLELSVSGIDMISEYLFRKTDLETYVAEEALSRVDEGNLSTWKKATAYSEGDKVFAPFNYITSLKDVHDIWPEVVGWFIPIGTKYIPKSSTSKNKYFELIAIVYGRQGQNYYSSY